VAIRATDLRGLLEQLHAATRQVARSGTEEQRAAAATILTDARRSLYLLLADGPQASNDQARATDRVAQ